MNRTIVRVATMLGLVLGSWSTGNADTFGSGANGFVMDFVTIGNPNNPDDTEYGAVGTPFRMAISEVSQDMITKANTEGSLGITFQDLSEVGANGADYPATGISWNEAARFVNWLNVSSGYSPAYKFATQPDSAEYNPDANIELWTISDSGYNPTNPFRNANAFYFLPSEDEWYKAAYYGGTGSIYFDYATQQNEPPTPVPGGNAGAVYNQNSEQGPTGVDNSGGPSFYGTIGQNGNVWEWNESAFDGTNDTNSEPRGIRGGSWDSLADLLHSSDRSNGAPESDYFEVGFRVASVPEPSVVILMAIGLTFLFLKYRRSR